MYKVNADTTAVQTPAASKNDSEKADLSLIPQIALEAAARAFMVGEKKYGRYNYYKGHQASQLVAAMQRHGSAWMEGEENDPKDGQPHLGSVIACAAMLLQQQKLGTLKDNRYKEPAAEVIYKFEMEPSIPIGATIGSLGTVLTEGFRGLK